MRNVCACGIHECQSCVLKYKIATISPTIKRRGSKRDSNEFLGESIQFRLATMATGTICTKVRTRILGENICRKAKSETAMTLRPPHLVQ